VLSRVFGLLEGLAMAGLAAGSLLAPALVALDGAPAALIGLALVLPLVAGLAFRELLRIDQRATVPAVELSLVRSMPIFAGLAAPALEGLAASLRPRTLAPGEVLMRQGEPGRRFYAIAGGELDIAVDGMHLCTRRRGDGVGEIALLRSVPRTASVVARTEAQLFGLDKEPFLAAVTGHPPAAAVGEERLQETALRRAKELT
jgi:hypothetical protein